MDSPADNTQSSQTTVAAVEPEVTENVVASPVSDDAMPQPAPEQLETPAVVNHNESAPTTHLEPVLITEPAIQAPETDSNPEQSPAAAPEQPPLDAPEITSPLPDNSPPELVPEPQPAQPIETVVPPVVAEPTFSPDLVTKDGVNRPADVVNESSNARAPSEVAAPIADELPTLKPEEVTSEPEIQEQAEIVKPVTEQSNIALDTQSGEFSEAVLALSDDELKSATKLYLRRHHAERTRRGVAARQAKMNNKLEQVVAYISAHAEAQIPRMARELNISPQLLSSYLQKLVKQGRIKASGWQKNRRYFL